MILPKESAFPGSRVMDCNDRGLRQLRLYQRKRLKVHGQIVGCIYEAQIDPSIGYVFRQKVGLGLPNKAKVREVAKTVSRDLLRLGRNVVAEDHALRIGRLQKVEGAMTV